MPLQPFQLFAFVLSCSVRGARAARDVMMMMAMMNMMMISTRPADP